MTFPQRKPNRLKKYDYSQPGYYFITICTEDKVQILGNIVGGDALIAPQMHLSSYGEIVRHYIDTVPGIDKYVIMSNHIHMIVAIPPNGPMWASAPTQSIPQIVKSFKTLITKHVGFPLFQRSYHDHIIRNDADYRRIWQYIDENPLKWELDRYYIP